MLMIRNYSHSDYGMIKQWWEEAQQCVPPEHHMPEESSFVLELDGVPSLAVSLYMTNVDIAWVDNLIGNPKMKGEDRKKAVKVLLDRLEEFCKSKGKRVLFCMSLSDATTRRYEQLGFLKSQNGVSTFIKEIK